MFQIPNTYPRGGPLYWRDEVTGVLGAAVKAYFNDRLTVTPEQVLILCDYCRHWANAPVWQGEGVADLRSKAQRMATVSDLAEWLDDAIGAGIDPF